MSAAFDAYLDLTAVAASRQPSPVEAMFIYDFCDGIDTGAFILRGGDCFMVKISDESRFRLFRSFILSRIPGSTLQALPNPEGPPPAFCWIDDATALLLNAEQQTERYCCIGDPYLQWFVASPLMAESQDLNFKDAHLILASKFRSTMTR
jgi:hypothetical protein